MSDPLVEIGGTSMKERSARGRQQIRNPKSDFVFVSATTPDALSEFRSPSNREWKSPEFEVVDAELRRFSEEHTKIGGYASADVQSYENYEKLAPYLLVLDVQSHPLDFKYTCVGEHVSMANERPLLGSTINELRMRNRRKYGLCGHQAEMFCLFMDAYMLDEVFATSRNMTVCVNDTLDLHKTKDLDISAVRASSNGLYPDKIISVAMIGPTTTN